MKQHCANVVASFLNSDERRERIRVSFFKGDRPKETKNSKTRRKPMSGLKSSLFGTGEGDLASAQQNLTTVSQVSVKYRFNPRTRVSLDLAR